MLEGGASKWTLGLPAIGVTTCIASACVRYPLGDAVLGCVDACVVALQPELLAKRALDAVASEDFAFDFRGLHGLVADKLDFEHVPVILADMLEGAQELPGFDQEFTFEGL